MSRRSLVFFDRLARRWRRRSLANAAVFAVLTLVPFELLLVLWAGAPAWWLPLAAAVGLGLSWVSFRGQPSFEALAHHLDRSIPEIEESADLLLRDAGNLNALERLQLSRAERALGDRHVNEVALAVVPAKSWSISAAVALTAGAVVWLASSALGPGSGSARGPEIKRAGAVASAREFELLAEVQPPPYTGLPVSEADSTDLSALEGSVVRWSLEGLSAGEQAALVFGDREIGFSSDGELGPSTAEREIRSSQLYFLRVTSDGAEVEHTAYARVRMIPDRAADIRITQPQPFLLLPETGRDRLRIVAEISDDFRVEETSLVVTVAAGSGERVEFRERRYDLPRRQGDSKTGEYSRLLDLEALGVGPGADLYFFVEVVDNRWPVPNRSQSPTHIVRRPGGGGQSVGLGQGLPMFAVPDLFRSQRQIILDTEKLLSEEAEISRSELERRSQGLGFDQRALRMRYGVLLGQEFVDGRPLTEREEALEFEDDEELGELIGELPEGVVHAHDPQDLNTFFDSDVRDRMRAALKEMWGAEGSLRTNEPRAALPFEYRALYLLKQAQERSRVYVQKVGFDSPPLFPVEKRLTGDLSKIAGGVLRSQMTPEPGQTQRVMLEGLDAVERNHVSSSDVLAAVAAARRELLRDALEGSSDDLLALQAAAELEVELAEEVRTDTWVELDAAQRVRLNRVRAALWNRLAEPEIRLGLSQGRSPSLFLEYLEELTTADGGGA